MSTYASQRRTDLEGLPLFDFSRNKHGGNAESAAANERIAWRKSDDRETCYRTIEENPKGITSHEISHITGIPLQTVSGRLSELKAMQRIQKKNNERRDGCAVLVIKEGV